MSNSPDLNARSDSSAHTADQRLKLRLGAQLKSASQQLRQGWERGWEIIRVREMQPQSVEAAPLKTSAMPLTSTDLRDAKTSSGAVVDRQVLKLQDGRRVSFRTLGTEGAKEWILFHHGYPGSSCQAKLMHELAREHGWGVLAIDRPGFAQSDFDAGRSLKTTAYDAIEVATKLGVSRFHVVGVSGGAPYALATAAAAPQRTRSLSTVGGLAQLAAPDLEAKLSAFEKFCVRRARSGGVTAHLLFGWMERGVRQDEEAVIKRWIDRLAPADRAEMEKPELREVLVSSLKEAIEPGIRGVIADLRLLASPWDFSLEHVDSPAWIWHGTEDNVVPYAHGVYLATGLRKARLMTVEGAGHYSLCLTERQKIVEQILSFAEQSDARPPVRSALSPELT
ncbi:MAG TPA: alpha/beta hydrolase [Pseudobdellovibrionaceae bacterium]|nr:alpha/beta hydrolase [Pseudobdellovibrionaceae bacterium]